MAHICFVHLCTKEGLRIGYVPLFCENTNKVSGCCKVIVVSLYELQCRDKCKEMGYSTNFRVTLWPQLDSLPQGRIGIACGTKGFGRWLIN
jgi:hypothetical protein